MLTSSICSFTDPDEYASAMQQATVGFTVTRSGNFAAKVTRIELHRLSMQGFSANLGWTSHIDYWGGRVAIPFQTRAGPNMTRNGHEYPYNSIGRLSASQSYYLRSDAAASYGTVSLPLDEMAALGAVVGERDLALGNDHLTILTPPASALGKLRRLHEAAGHLAADAPAVLAHPQAARGLEEAMTEAMMRCLRGDMGEEDKSAERRHAAIMRKFHRFVEQSADQPIYIPELCREIGVSERTLRACCDEHLGISPKHYLLLRRMHMVRRALRVGAPSKVTVTEIATRYGFWQFGRLAVEYRALFGETPSTTLARPA